MSKFLGRDNRWDLITAIVSQLSNGLTPRLGYIAWFVVFSVFSWVSRVGNPLHD
jgi:hypothetical protein